VGDFNGDGVSDLILGLGGQSGLEELLGTGTGSFYAAVSYFVQISIFGNGLAVGDLNGDGRPDVVIPDQGGMIGVFLNAGGTTRQPTSVAVTSSQNPVPFNSQPTITATVSPAGGSPQGSVTFYVDGLAVLGNFGQLNSSNQATCCPVLPNFSVGTYKITAIYSGDTATEGSTGNTLLETVVPIPTSTFLVSAPNPSLGGQAIALTAEVSAFDIRPDGSVTFFDGAHSLGTVPVTPEIHAVGSIATLDVSNLTVGTHSITAAFGKSTNFAPSTSPVVQQVVTGSLNLMAAAGSKSSATVVAGGSVKYMLSIGGAGIDAPASLSCTGLPTGVTCAVPPSVPIRATSVTDFSVGVTTTARSMGMLRQSDFGPSPWLWALALMGWVVLPGTGRAKRPARRYFHVLPLLLLLFLCSCGGGGGGNSSGTPAGTYTLTVTAKVGSTSTNQSLPLTLTVQ
jgi:hypothetical protein